MQSVPLTLLNLARQEFASRSLSAAEEALFSSVETSKIASSVRGDDQQDDPASAINWTADRVIRAECIAWLCTDGEATKRVTHRGISIRGMRIDGVLDLSDAKIDFPIAALKCAFMERLIFRDAHLRTLILSASHTKDVLADRLTLAGSLFLRQGFKAQGELRLLGVSIGGSLDCSGAKLSNPQGKALSADGACIGGDVLLREGFMAEGEVRFLRTTIGRNFDCDSAKLSNPEGMALDADGATVRGDVFLRSGFTAFGEVKLLATAIGGSLDCETASFSNSDGVALNADRAKIAGAVFLRRGFRAKGEVRLVRASIGLNLECDGAQCSNVKKNALDADGAKIDGSVFLRNGFNSDGQVNLLGATIGGALECDSAQFSNPQSTALNADMARIGAAIFLRKGSKVNGRVNFAAVRVGGHLQIHGLIASNTMELNLRDAKIGTLWDERGSWPEPGKLFLDGLVYDRLHENAPFTHDSRVDWLRRQPRSTFLPQPYEHLASVLRQMGHEREARSILVEKNRTKGKFARFPRQDWLWYKIFGRAIGYGYRPLRALWMSILVILVGTLVFRWAFAYGLISPTKENAYSTRVSGLVEGESRHPADNYAVFNSFAYSLESFTPFLKLDQTSNWQPNANRGVNLHVLWWPTTVGALLRYFLWLHIITGWVLTTLWVGAVTGIAKT